MAFRINSLDVYFSYDTVVAFREVGHELVVHENDWGPTTGKHLNWLDSGEKKNRVPHDEFEQKLQAVLDKHDLVIERNKRS